jgi:hypothetical protein
MLPFIGLCKLLPVKLPPNVVALVYRSRNYQLQERRDTMTYQVDFTLPDELLK